MNRAKEVTSILTNRIINGLQDTVEWFEQQMPDHYFRVTSEAERIFHLEIIHSLRRMPESGLTMIDDVNAGKLLVFGRSISSSDMFHEALSLVGDHPFHRTEIHTTSDRRFAIFAFVYGEESVPENHNTKQHRQNILKAASTGSDCVPKHVIEQYLKTTHSGYVARSSPERIARHVRAWIAVADVEQIYVSCEEFNDDSQDVTRILFAGQLGRHKYTHLLARFLDRNKIHLHRGYMDQVPSQSGKHSLLISTIYVTSDDGSKIHKRQRDFLATQLLGLKRTFSFRIGELYDQTHYAQHHFEILVAAIDFASQLLPLDHPFLDVREVGRTAMSSMPDLCLRIAELVDHRFGEKAISAKAWERRYLHLLEEVREITDSANELVLEMMLQFIHSIELTNCYTQHRLGQSFKINPSILPVEHYPNRPFGIFYFHGCYGVGFHVRFKASARGGLRLLLPRTHEQFIGYRNRLLQEVSDLAFAQQLKNKDIPEGGSKCIAMVQPGGDADEMVKQLTDSLLDLILPEESTPDVRGAHGQKRKQELIFLGPDENMNPQRIMWVAQRAHDRGLPHHLTLMSSKPGAGINHKEYGVTSEGVSRWITHVLKVLNIGPKQSWTLTMTGGPDGDVGGNLLRILARDDRKRARVLAIADGSGCAYDPDGLNWPELLRLVSKSKAIAEFDPTKITGAGGHVTAATDKASEELRNTLHTTIQTDIFVPCGGRPYTINDKNWMALCPHDKPIMRAMVEGANIFISSQARDEIQKRGVLVIKDSSANKCGVITSSYEILAGLLLDENEFTSIKKTYVVQVIEKLRSMVDDEAQALLEAWRRRQQNALLADLSRSFSSEINRLETLFSPLIAKMLKENRYTGFWTKQLHAHCPAILIEKFESRLNERLPKAHLVAILTKRLASRMLYREGLTWCQNYVSEERASDVLESWLQAYEQVTSFISQVKDVVTDPQILEIVTDGTRREWVRRQLGR